MRCSTAAGSPSATSARASSSPTSSSSGRCCRSRRSSAPGRSPRAADLMICVGSSLEVFPAAGLPELTLAHGGARRARDEGPDALRPRRRAQARRRRRRRAARRAGGARDLAAGSPDRALADRRLRLAQGRLERRPVGRVAAEDGPLRPSPRRRPRPGGSRRPRPSPAAPRRARARRRRAGRRRSRRGRGRSGPRAGRPPRGPARTAATRSWGRSAS